MTNGHGGHRTPRNPAPASGPGRLSRRTDGGPGQKLSAPTGMDYGDHQNLMAQERTAAMSQQDSLPSLSIPTPSQAQAAGPSGAPAGPPLPPLNRPTERPNEPITHGVDIGAGAGPEVLPPQHQPDYQQFGPMTQMLSRLSASDMTGALASVLSFSRAIGA